MGIRIKRVAVLGAGVMGQGIAAHLANAGIPSYLFDIAPGELTEDEKKKGLTLESRVVRNRIADAGVAAMIKAKPALLYRPDPAPLVAAGLLHPGPLHAPARVDPPRRRRPEALRRDGPLR